jgi:tRNA U34 5-carboxymethylaminomethyl modifying enzyme MnmG/GidA
MISIRLHFRLLDNMKIPGLRNCELRAPGYYVEYDFIQPTELVMSDHCRFVENLLLIV